MATVVSVPYYMGTKVDGLAVPEPHIELVPKLPDSSEQDRMAAINAALATTVATVPKPVVYSGDCVAIVGVLAGLQRLDLDPVLVFYDAHGDFNTWETTPSGFIGGMPLAMVTGRGEMTIVDGAGMSLLDDADAVLVDGRDLDPDEAVLLDTSGVRRIAVDQVLNAIPADRPLYVHVDVDVVDPSDLPAINYPAPDGPSLAAVVASVTRLAETGRVVAFSVSTWNPALDGADVAAAATLEIASPFLR